MTTAAEMVEFYIDAEKKVLTGQSVTFRGRVLTRANLVDIRAGRREWEEKARKDAASRAGGSSHYSLADFSQ